MNLEIARHPGAVTVPRVAVAGLGVEPFAMVVRGDTARRQVLTVIDWPSERIVVREGLKAGDTVAVTPKAVPEGIAVRTRLGPNAL